MIKNNKVVVSVNLRNSKYYRNMGYNIEIKSVKDKQNIEVDILDINKNSKIKIIAVCDICRNEKEIPICKYWANFERGGHNFYSCFDCKKEKNKLTILEKYGVDSYSKTDEFKEKFKKTSLKNYGVDNPNKNTKIREKIKNTNIERYGVETYFQTKEIKEKNKIWMSSEEFRLKSKKSLIEKYNTDSYSKTSEFKNKISIKKDLIIEKIKNTFLKKYGVDWYTKSDRFKLDLLNNYTESENKRKNTCLERYGVDNISKDKNIMDKSYKTKLKLNLIISPENLSEWQIYKKNVRRETNKYKKQLFENWNGLDYYDNENIIGNFSYSHTNKLFPTIDHKISTFFGFKNNIPYQEIGNISNLCITKKGINSMKNSIIEDVFIKNFKNTNI